MIEIDAEHVVHGVGHDAVVSAGFVGFSLGATPTAMANMTVVNAALRSSRCADGVERTGQSATGIIAASIGNSPDDT